MHVLLETISLKVGAVKIVADNDRVGALTLRFYRDCDNGQ